MAVTARNELHDATTNPYVGWKWHVAGGPKGETQSGLFKRRADCCKDALRCNLEFRGRPWGSDDRIVLGWKDTEKLDAV